MGYILMGHGGFVPDPSVTPPGMESVAIPSDTTIQFYSDAGQRLGFGRAQLDAWTGLDVRAFWPPLDSRNVTYNLALYGDPWRWLAVLRNESQFGEHEVILPGIRGVPDPAVLCKGTPDTCPTRPEQVVDGAKHDCSGLLARLEGELHWLSCTTFEEAGPEVIAGVLDGMLSGVVLGDRPDWRLGPEDRDAIDLVNAACVTRAGTAYLPFTLGGSVLLLGSGHDYKHEFHAASRGDALQGAWRVNGSGELCFDRVPPEDQDTVRAAIGRFSPAGVRFGP
ncbi:hypothetical protein ACFQ78_27475 [Streptomyces sp. NPDC056519]|uniref:hypothetical protein n=1 Tax=Streptomyces sp. NPDC056519 TaxID=3345849 RepID=UPI0036CEB2A4